jgi:hypothetical protein
MALPVTYCELWSGKLRSPTGVLTEAEARDRDARGELYCVVLGDPAAPRIILEVAWMNAALGVSFFDEEGRMHTEYLFGKTDTGKLFMHNVTTWSYPEGARSKSQASYIETAQFRPDGYASRTLENSSAGRIKKTEYTDVPMDANWEPIPEFGHWESVARYDRDAPPPA